MLYADTALYTAKQRQGNWVSVRSPQETPVVADASSAASFAGPWRPAISLSFSAAGRPARKPVLSGWRLGSWQHRTAG